MALSPLAQVACHSGLVRASEKRLRKTLGGGSLGRVMQNEERDSQKLERETPPRVFRNTTDRGQRLGVGDQNEKDEDAESKRHERENRKKMDRDGQRVCLHSEGHIRASQFRQEGEQFPCAVTLSITELKVLRTCDRGMRD